MDLFSAQDLFLVLAAAVIGGVFAKLLKFQPLVGYILGGIVFGSILRANAAGIANFAEIGTILLLFSIGVELSFKRLGRVFKVATIGAILQMVFVTIFAFLILSSLGFSGLTAFILSMGFSLSSTAVVVKMLSDRGETDTLHGELMIGWLLVQDLAVIPMMVILPTLASGGFVYGAIGLSLVKAAVVVAGVVILGKLVAPFLIHQVAATNSRELLVVSAVALALGTAYAASLFGVSSALQTLRSREGVMGQTGIPGIINVSGLHNFSTFEKVIAHEYIHSLAFHEKSNNGIPIKGYKLLGAIIPKK